MTGDSRLSRSQRHDTQAPFWAAALFIALVTGVSTVWVDLGMFWKSYVLDMTGPAWSYILFRGKFTAFKNTLWTRFFTPKRTIVLLIAVCYSIEGAQFLGFYDATFDPWDFLAYISILVPMFVLDLVLLHGGRMTS